MKVIAPSGLVAIPCFFQFRLGGGVRFARHGERALGLIKDLLYLGLPVEWDPGWLRCVRY